MADLLPYGFCVKRIPESLPSRYFLKMAGFIHKTDGNPAVPLLQESYGTCVEPHVPKMAIRNM